eukprot:TRINITY_DN250_c0_g1_i3.p1 TRINITY_DN250_c0_g1~~TRINITY_DN250_c0_g1_i3.p1  ORF type:complete len:713 (-),score=149.42 TRINITY_DN250_c0_g1_i3:51-2138(-)
MKAFSRIPRLIIGTICLCRASLALKRSRREHPVERVIELLRKLSVTVENEGKNEALLYDKFSTYCSRSRSELEEAIAQETEAVSSLSSKIESEEKMLSLLADQIQALSDEKLRLETSEANAAQLRQQGKTLYESARKDFEDTITAIESALTGLQSSQGVTFAQMQSLRGILEMADVTLSGEGTVHVDTPVRPDLKAKGDREAHVKVYDYKSGKVIEILKQLLERFENELHTATKEETNADNNRNLEEQSQQELIAVTDASMREKTTQRTEVEGSLAKHKTDLQTEKDDLTADESSLGDLKTTCTVKAQEWEERSAVRAKELEAMGAAVEILARVTGVRTTPPSNPSLPPAPVESTQAGAAIFLQIRNPMQRAVAMLRTKALKLNSKYLIRVAGELSSHMDDPFNAVNNMIEKMIFHLMGEQTDEDNHKNWCDKEMNTTNSSRLDKEEKLDELSANLEVARAKVQLLANDVEQAAEMVAKIDEFAAEAKEIREIGRRENDEAIKHAQDAQSALAEANSVISAFYKQTGKVNKEAWELLQRGVVLPAEPSTWDSGYTGVAEDADSSILAVLERVQSDFAKMEADTRAQESTDQAAYEEQMKASSIEKAARTQETEMKTAEKQRLVDKINAMESKKKQVAAQLEAVVQYYSDLGPACYHGDSTYEDRKSARSEEIEALKSAKGILATAFEDAPQNETK